MAQPNEILLSGVVLAAGRSVRFGREKALVEIGGETLWARQYRLLEEVRCGERLLSVRGDQDWVPKEVRRVLDDEEGCGPLAGIVAALTVCRGTHLAVVAVDLPRIGVEWFELLGERTGKGIGAVGRRDGFFEPLAAIYPRELLADAEDALRRGKYSLQALLELGVARKLIRTIEVGKDQAAWFENWNEPGDRGV
jgi:molybdenum cofactor guanylyltransferase